MFSSYSEWNNTFISQTDHSEFYDNTQKDCSVFVDGGNGAIGGCVGGISVCVNSGESGEIQPPPLEPFNTNNQFYENSDVNFATITNMFPIANEQSVNLHNHTNYNNTNSFKINNNSLQLNMNTQNQASALCCNNNYNNNNNNNNCNTNYTFCQNEHIKNQQFSLQQQQQQQHHQPQPIYPKSNSFNNPHNNFFNVPQQQTQQQFVFVRTPSTTNQQTQNPLNHHHNYQHHQQEQQPVANQPHNFPPPPPPSRMSNYYNNLHCRQAPTQFQQSNQVYELSQYQNDREQFDQHLLTNHIKSIPCQGNQPWTYAYCYGYGPYINQEPCQFTQVVDIEDFMNNEKRKERSRDAARCRRSRETEIFTELAQELPLKNEDAQQLDKASVMRIAVAYLKVRDMLKMFPKIQELIGDLEISASTISANNDTKADTPAVSNTIDCHDTSTQSSQLCDDSTQQTIVENENPSSFLKATNNSDDMKYFSLLLKQTLDGFLLILSNEGDITYVTGNITDYLGLSKIDVLGQQIWEYAHQCDHEELKEALNIKRNGLTEKVMDANFLEEGISSQHRDLFVRLKCTITSRGRSINIKSASYKVIHITGNLLLNTKGDRVLVAIGRPIPHPSNIEVPLGTSTFLTKHSLDMKFTYVDEKMFHLLGYKSEDLLETSLFNYHHGMDTESLMHTFKNVLSKGQGETCRYRFLGKYGGYCWIVTQATVVYDKLKPQSVVCVNFVISNLERNNEIYTLQQYESKQKFKLNENAQSVIKNNSKEDIESDHNLKEYKETAPTLESLHPATANPVENPTPFNNNHKTHDIDYKEEEINNKIDGNITNNIKPSIKLEQITTVSSNNNKTFPSKPSATETVALRDNNSPLLPTALIQPPQRQLPTVPLHCPTTTVTHTIFSKIKTSPKFVCDDKHPKTVTSSQTLTSLPTTTSTQSILLQQQPLNVATRAPQSVTASVFSPLPPPNLPSTTAIATLTLPQEQQQLKASTTQLDQSLTSVQQPKATNVNHQQDMNKGYLTFVENATELTMLKEEPDDVAAHLVATNAVEACMPLDESGPLFGEILVGFGMGSYGSLLHDDIHSLDSNTSSNDHSNNNTPSSNNQTAIKPDCSSLSSPKTSSATTLYNGTMMRATSSHNLRQSSPSLIGTKTCATSNKSTSTTAATTNPTNIDPFINYRDESNDTNCSQHLLSPSVTSKSPEGSSLPSLCSPNSLSQEDEFSYYTMNVDDMDDLTMRAPYIPMNEQDDLPLLTSDDYMWSSGNAFTPDEFSLHAKDSDNLQAFQINQSLNYQQQQFTQQQQHMQQFSNSLCSSPASTVASKSPSPIEQQQQQYKHQLLSADSSELATLLCGNGNSSITILHPTNFTNSLNLNVGESCSVNNSNSENGGVGLTEDMDSISVGSPTAVLDHHQELQQHCLLQLQEQLEQQQRQQQRQQLLNGLNINCKKEKFETANNSPSLASNLCDTIDDTFDNVYSKNSTNLDCWNEFLQIGSNENTNTTNSIDATTITQHQQRMENLRQEDCKQQLQLQQPQQQQQQNIIINTVPLITIQTTTTAAAAATSNNNTNVLVPTINNRQQQMATQNSQSITNALNKVNTIKLTPITSTATIKIIDSKQQQSLMQQQQAQQNIIKTAFIQSTPSAVAVAALHSNNKRHSSNTPITNNTGETKRLRSNIMDLQNSTALTSQLLQQLITTPQQQQSQQQHQGNLNAKNAKSLLDTKWLANETQTLAAQQKQQQKQQQQQQKQSNSVLKNLLISGCDTNNLSKMEIDTIEENSSSSMPSPKFCCLATSLSRALQDVNSSTSLLRNYRHNPWIGEPSPTKPLITDEDSNPPGLTTCCDAIDSTSNSGIDDASITENMSPLKRSFDQQKNQIENIFGMKTATINIKNTSNANDKNPEYDNNLKNIAMKDKEFSKINIIKPENKLMRQVELGENLDEDGSEAEAELGASISKRKRSLSYLDSSNPLMTPFLMDLCNDDYHMNSKEYLQENDIENVLNEWHVDLV